MVMHTRIYGQFAVLSVLLSLMGWKTHMDSEGRFVTREEAREDLEEVEARRRDMLEFLEEQQGREEAARERRRRAKEATAAAAA